MNRHSLAFSAHVIYTFERQCGTIDLFKGKRKNTKRTAARQGSNGENAVRSTGPTVGSDTILLKSPRGREEVQTRAHDLPLLARRLLIMADGEHTVSDLARELDCHPSDPTLHAALARLVDEHYLHISDEYDRRRRRLPPGRRKGAAA